MENKIPCPIESIEQTWLFRWAEKMAHLKWPELELLYHTPRGVHGGEIERQCVAARRRTNC